MFFETIEFASPCFATIGEIVIELHDEAKDIKDEISVAVESVTLFVASC